MNKCHTPIGFHNNTTPALNETNLNYLDGCVDTIDDRVVAIANDPPANALKAEGWAIGEQSGVPVTSDSPYYENNSKYYSQESANEVLKSEGFANGTQNGTPVTSGSPYYENNAKYWKEQAQAIASSSLSGLSDVSITNPQDGDLLTYNAGNSEWKNDSSVKGSINDIYSTIGGNNLLIYPFYETSKSLNGLTFVDNGDGTVTVSGTATANTNFVYADVPQNHSLVNNKTYILNGCPSGGGESTYQIYFCYKTTSNDYSEYYRDYGSGVTIPYSYTGTGGVYFGAVRIMAGAAITTPITFKPMIRDASIADDTWQPYGQSKFANKTDLTSIIVTGTTNNTGATIPNASYFYLNGVFCRAINTIAANATLTLNTNYKVATLGGDITEKAFHKTGLTTSSNEAISIPINLRIGIVVTHDELNNTSLGIVAERNDTWKLIHVTGNDSIAKITNNQLVIGTAYSRYTILYA